MTWEELSTHTLVMYTTTWCPDCTRLKQRLDEHNVSYSEIDIDADADAAKRLKAQTGRAAIPYVQVDGLCMVRGWHDGKPGRWDGELFLREVVEGLAEA